MISVPLNSFGMEFFLYIIFFNLIPRVALWHIDRACVSVCVSACVSAEFHPNFGINYKNTRVLKHALASYG
jgi:hypothetical protein